MPPRDALLERAKKAGDASRYQLHVYVGANDYFYEQVRRGPVSLQDLPGKLGQLSDDGVEPLRRAVKAYTPSKLREVVQERVGAARERREEFAGRGETIVADWHQALAVKDANSLITSVREADGPADLAKSLKTWLAEFPPAEAAKPVRKPTPRATPKPTAARKTTARKTTARKPAARKPAATTQRPARSPHRTTESAS
jgi:hypothetical protein